MNNLTGSPGRARTADLVINSSRNTLLWLKKVEECQGLFWGPFGLKLLGNRNTLDDEYIEQSPCDCPPSPAYVRINS